jgi:hypothetical protein
MTDEVPANPEGGADNGPLTVDGAAERLRGMLSSDAATENTEADTGNASAEGAEPTEEASQEAESTTETEADPTEESSDLEEKQPRYTVKINGEERRVTLEEMKKNHMFEADYRQKTAKLAEEKREVEAERAHYGQQLKAVIPALHAQIQDKFAAVDWQQLANDNPAEYVKLRAEADIAGQRLSLAMAEQHRLQTQEDTERKTKYAEFVKSEATKLAEKLPVFADPEKSKAVKAQVKGHLKSIGYSDEEISQLADHRAATVAYESYLYRQAQKAKTVAATTAVQKNVPKVQKPGAPTRENPKLAALSAANERFTRSGKVDDLAAVLRARNRS